MQKNNALLNIPRVIIEKSHEALRKLNSDIRNSDLIHNISPYTGDFLGIFTDGSSIYSERRGCAVAVFSANSIVSGIRRKSRVLEHVFDVKPFYLIIIPKINVPMRVHAIMHGIEYVSALAGLRKHSDEIELVSFDGSFIKAIREPFNAVLNPFKEFAFSHINNVGKEEGLKDIIAIIRALDKEVTSWLKEIFNSNDAKAIIKSFRDEYYLIIDHLFDDLMQYVTEDDMFMLQNYLMLFVEQNFYIFALLEILRVCEEKRIPGIWISKDSEARVLVRRYPELKYSSDLTILDSILKDGEFIVLSEFLPLQTLNYENFVVKSKGDIISPAKVHAIANNLAIELYEKFGSYNVVYVKMKNFTLRITFPEKLLSASDVNNILAMLNKISPKGYPEPLMIAHYRCILREKLADRIAESLYRNCDENMSSIICSLLSKLGREIIL